MSGKLYYVVEVDPSLGIGGGPVYPPSQPPGIWPSPGHPAHPIAPGGPPPVVGGGPIFPPSQPPGIWPQPPGGNPPVGGYPGFPAPPPGIWPSPGHPAHPIAPGGPPPVVGGGPIYPGGPVDPGAPPLNPPPGGYPGFPAPPPGIWGGGPHPMPPIQPPQTQPPAAGGAPEHPIVMPPGTPLPPGAAEHPIAKGWSLGYWPGTGWVLIPPSGGAGGNVPPHPSVPPDQPGQQPPSGSTPPGGTPPGGQPPSGGTPTPVSGPHAAQSAMPK